MNRTPPAAVIIVHRNAPARSSACAVFNASSTVRLVLTRMNVISKEFQMLAGSKTRGQSAAEFRRYLYANKTAPKVQASEMMKSHITSLLDGMAKGRSS